MYYIIFCRKKKVHMLSFPLFLYFLDSQRELFWIFLFPRRRKCAKIVSTPKKEAAATETARKAAELFRQYGKRFEFPCGAELYNSVVQQSRGVACFLESGSCSLSGLTWDGKQQIFLYSHGPRLVGFTQHMPAVQRGDEPHIIITAKTSCVVYQMGGELFARLLQQEPLFQKYVMQVLAENYVDLLRHYQSSQSQCATARLCTFLLNYAQQEGGRLCMPAYFTLSEVSHYLGVHTVTVSRIVAQLRQRGYIEKEGRRVILLDPDGLGQLVKEHANFDF